MSSAARAWVGLLVVAIGVAGCMAPVPTAPAGLGAHPGDQMVSLSWFPNSEFDLKNYNVYWGSSPNALSQTVSVTQPVSAANIPNLNNGTTYYFAVDAENLLGQRSERSPAVSATPGAGLGNGSGPAISGTVPQTGMINVALNQELKVEFNAPMNIASVQLIVQPPLMLGNPEWLSGNTEIRFPTHGAFAKATVYRVTVEGRDTNGDELAGLRTFQFTTENVDETAPIVLETSPGQGATNFSVCAPIAIRFSESMQPGALGFPITMSPDFPWSEVWNANFTILYLVPNEPLANGTQYSYTISTAAMDTAGNPFAAPYFGTFITEPTPDTTLPEVISQSPPAGSTAGANPVPIVVRFTEPMDTAYTQSNFEVYSYGVKVAGNRSWNLSGTELTFQPLTSFVAGNLVTVLMDYRDVAGNTATGYVSQFWAP